MSTIFGKIIRGASNTVVGTVDTALSQFGAGGLIPDAAYSSTKAANTWTAFQDASNTIKNTIANAIVPGSGTLMSGLQSLNPSQKSSGDTVTQPTQTIDSTAYGNTLQLPAQTQNVTKTSDIISQIKPEYYIIGAIVLILIVLIITYLL